MLAIVMNSMECNGYATLVALTSRAPARDEKAEGL